MEYDIAIEIANETLELLRPHCYRCEIAGSLRRKKPEVKDIEIVAIPKPFDVGLFKTGLATVVNRWPKIKGTLTQWPPRKGESPCKYTQRLLPQGINLDLWFATEHNWGLIYATRTGSAEFSHKVLACGWVKQGYRSVDGYLTKDGKKYAVREEEELFALIGLPCVPPELRNI